MLLPPGGPPNWPPSNGCARITLRKKITLPEGMLLDRIGPTEGRFVAVLQRTPSTRQAKPASYSSRSLRSLGETPYMLEIDGKEVDLRKIIYEKIYDEKNDEDNELYYVLRVKKPMTIKNPCKAVKYFGYPGGALQLELPKTVQELLNDGSLEKIPVRDWNDPIKGMGPGFPRFPPYSDPDDGKDAAFRPLEDGLDPLMELYYSTEADRKAYRNDKGMASTPAGPTRPAISVETATPTPAPRTPSPSSRAADAATGVASPNATARALFQSPAGAIVSSTSPKTTPGPLSYATVASRSSGK
jgi:hypothetical protein